MDFNERLIHIIRFQGKLIRMIKFSYCVIFVLLFGVLFSCHSSKKTLDIASVSKSENVIEIEC